MPDLPMYTLHVETTYDDGHTSKWAYQRTGDATAAHAALAKRWREAGHSFDRDAEALTLTRRYDHPEIGSYVDVITHIPWED